jgi:hypothetical protein
VITGRRGPWPGSQGHCREPGAASTRGGAGSHRNGNRPRPQCGDPRRGGERGSPYGPAPGGAEPGPSSSKAYAHQGQVTNQSPEMAPIGRLVLCCRTRGSYVEGAGQNSSHSLTWDKRITSMAADCAPRLASSPPPISDFCPRPALRAAPARGAAVPGAARRAPPRGPPRRLSVTPCCGHVSGRTDRDNELMTRRAMLRGGSVVERCHGLASGHGSREPTRDQPREACRGRHSDSRIAPASGAAAQ